MERELTKEEKMQVAFENRLRNFERLQTPQEKAAEIKAQEDKILAELNKPKIVEEKEEKPINNLAAVIANLKESLKKSEVKPMEAEPKEEEGEKTVNEVLPVKVAQINQPLTYTMKGIGQNVFNGRIEQQQNAEINNQMHVGTWERLEELDKKLSKLLKVNKLKLAVIFIAVITGYASIDVLLGLF